MDITAEDFTSINFGSATYNITPDAQNNIKKAVLININDKYKEITGLELQSGDAINLTGDNWIPRLRLYNEKAREGVFSQLTEHFFKSDRWSLSWIRKCTDGSIRIICTDITQFYSNPGKNEMQENSYRFFLENIQGIAFQVKSTKGKIETFLTGAHEELTGFKKEKFNTIDSFFSIINPEDLPRVKKYNKRLYEVSNNSQEIEYRITTKNGQQKWLKSYDSNVEGEDGIKLIQGIIFDVTEQKEQEKKLKEAYNVIKKQNERLDLLSRTDHLTGVNNRRAFMDSLEIEIARSNRRDSTFSIIMSDLDHFKRVNDTWGHETGDDVLIKTAQLFRDNLRTIDSIARWGGEEFIILLENSDISCAEVTASKLRRKLEALTFTTSEGDIFSVTMSGGIAEYRKNEKTEQLLSRADKRLYRAKKMGRNRIETGRINARKG